MTHNSPTLAQAIAQLTELAEAGALPAEEAAAIRVLLAYLKLTTRVPHGEELFYGENMSYATTERFTRAMDVCVLALEACEHWLPTTEVARRGGMGVNEWRDARARSARTWRSTIRTCRRTRTGRRTGR